MFSPAKAAILSTPADTAAQTVGVSATRTPHTIHGCPARRIVLRRLRQRHTVALSASEGWVAGVSANGDDAGARGHPRRGLAHRRRTTRRWPAPGRGPRG